VVAITEPPLRASKNSTATLRTVEGGKRPELALSRSSADPGRKRTGSLGPGKEDQTYGHTLSTGKYGVVSDEAET
jgi:hypothetical protein